MSHIAVWTDGKERVHRKHYHPDGVDTSDVTDIVHANHNEPDTEPWQSVTEYYNTTDGFYYQVDDPLDGVSLTTQQEMLLNYVKENESREKLMDYVNELTGGSK